jgi:uncharacterized protein (DUF1499 family)
VLLVGVIAAAIFFTSKLTQINSSEEKIKKQLNMLKFFKEKQENAPTEKWEDYNKNKKEKLTEIYHKMKTHLDLLSCRMPKNIKEPLKFKEDIFKLQDALYAEASLRNLIFEGDAKSLGFKEYEKKIPAEEEVPVLTKKLSIIEELVNLMIESNADSLIQVEFLNYIDKELDGKNSLSYRIIPVDITMVSSIKDLAQYLYLLSESDCIFIVDNIRIDSLSDEKDELKTNLTISNIVFLENEK